MDKTGTRVFYDAANGNLVATLHRVFGGIERQPIEQLEYLDIGFDNFDPMTHEIVSVENGQPVIVSIYQESVEEKRIRKLEDALLLQAENEVGGIL